MWRQLLRDYLVELQRHAQELAACPADWMPWNYRETLARTANPPESYDESLNGRKGWTAARGREHREAPVKQRSEINESGRSFGQGQISNAF